MTGYIGRLHRKRNSNFIFRYQMLLELLSVDVYLCERVWGGFYCAYCRQKYEQFLNVVAVCTVGVHGRSGRVAGDGNARDACGAAGRWRSERGGRGRGRASTEARAARRRLRAARPAPLPPRPVLPGEHPHPQYSIYPSLYWHSPTAVAATLKYTANSLRTHRITYFPIRHP